MKFRTSKIIDPPIVEFKKNISDLLGKDGVIDLCQAVPSYPMPQKMKDYMIEGAFSEQLSYYTPDQGIIELREEICKLHGNNLVNKDEVITTAGANQGAFSVFTALFKAGDKVALPVPYYFNYDMALRMLDIEPVYYFLDEEDGFRFVFDKIDKSIFKSCKGFVLVNPNNPTGAEYDEEDIKKLSHQCNKDGVILISDEAYGFFSKKGYPASSVLNITGSLNNLIVVNTFSKTFSMTGFRVAYVLAQKAFMDQIMKVQDSVIICAPKVSQYMALYGLKECHSWLDEKVKYVQSNASHFRELCKTQLKGFSLSSCANFFAYIKHPFNNISSYEASIKVAKQAKILTLPGAIFGPEQDSYLRLAFGNVSDPSKLSEVVSRLSAM